MKGQCSWGSSILRVFVLASSLGLIIQIEGEQLLQSRLTGGPILRFSITVSH